MQNLTLSINGSTLEDFLNKKDSLRDFQTDRTTTTKCHRVVAPSPVWIANRDVPLGNLSGVLNLTDKGTLDS